MVTLLVWTLTAAQAATPAFPHALAVNPIKPFLGLVNLEYDLSLAPTVSVHVFGEYAAVRTAALEQRGHPDAVGRAGVRWYPWASERCEGVEMGGNAGTTWTRGGDPTWFLGGEVGYRWFGTERFFLLPHALGGWGPPGPTLGFEAMVGVAL